MRFWPWLLSRMNPNLHRLREPVERHLGVDLIAAQSVTHNIKPIEHVNLQRVLDAWMADAKRPPQVYGYSTTGYSTDEGLAKYLITDELIHAPVERTQLDAGPEATLDCIVKGLILLWRDGAPVAVGVRPARFTREEPVLEVIAGTREAARDTLTALLEAARRDSVYKGRTLCLEQSSSWPPTVAVRFLPIRPTPREQIVLPAEVLAVVERNVLGMLRHAAALKAAGRSLRRGLLLHGPPGTGKTLVVRYLAGACTDHTVVVLSGPQQGLVREACQVARLLAPSIVVLEDVDLIAEDRDHNRCPAILQELMNEMDGLGERDEVTFLLTTNRPEVLEPTLSARPGRVDQAVEFPLPDAECRRRLFGVYGHGLDLSGIELDRWVVQTDGVSPAFIEELLRKAVLLAAERGEASQPIRLQDRDLDEGLKELIFFGGEITQKLLGYRPGRIGYQAGTRQ